MGVVLITMSADQPRVHLVLSYMLEPGLALK